MFQYGLPDGHKPHPCIEARSIEAGCNLHPRMPRIPRGGKAVQHKLRTKGPPPAGWMDSKVTDVPYTLFDLPGPRILDAPPAAGNLPSLTLEHIKPPGPEQ